MASQTEARYRAALARLRPSDRRLVVARVELGYSLEQLAVLTNRARVDTARVALRRAGTPKPLSDNTKMRSRCISGRARYWDRRIVSSRGR